MKKKSRYYNYNFAEALQSLGKQKNVEKEVFLSREIVELAKLPSQLTSFSNKLKTKEIRCLLPKNVISKRLRAIDKKLEKRQRECWRKQRKGEKGKKEKNEGTRIRKEEYIESIFDEFFVGREEAYFAQYEIDYCKNYYDALFS